MSFPFFGREDIDDGFVAPPDKEQKARIKATCPKNGAVRFQRDLVRLTLKENSSAAARASWPTRF